MKIHIALEYEPSDDEDVSAEGALPHNKYAEPCGIPPTLTIHCDSGAVILGIENAQASFSVNSLNLSLNGVSESLPPDTSLATGEQNASVLQTQPSGESSSADEQESAS
jgi:hypothetical protein